VRDLFKRGASEKSVHCIQIPKQSLILLPGIHPYALKWGLGKHGGTEAMQISGVFRATNTFPYVIRAAGIRLLEPRGVDIVAQMVTVDSARGMHHSKNLIRAGQIGGIQFMFLVTPVKGVAGRPLRASIFILDQFDNKHVVPDLEFKLISPEKLL
jgi:hypothetical protein